MSQVNSVETVETFPTNETINENGDYVPNNDETNVVDNENHPDEDTEDVEEEEENVDNEGFSRYLPRWLDVINWRNPRDFDDGDLEEDEPANKAMHQKQMFVLGMLTGYFTIMAYYYLTN